MVIYDVAAVADDLLLTPEELKEVFSLYFKDTELIVNNCKNAMARADYNEVGKNMHALKGASLNLRMQQLGKLTAELEILSKKQVGPELPGYLAEIQSEMIAVKAQVSLFYAKLDQQ